MLISIRSRFAAYDLARLNVFEHRGYFEVIKPIHTSLLFPVEVLSGMRAVLQ